jgi:O-antigen/teichoic acid export membrane protein
VEQGKVSGNRTEPTQSFDDELNARIVRSSLWVGLGHGGARLLSFASTLVLVRLLDPDDFGIAAVGMTLVAAVAQIQESGLGAALIHRRRHDLKTAASSVFVFAGLAGLALTGLTVLVAPLYTRLLRVPEATDVVQVLALILAIRGLTVTPGAILERELNFRARTHAELFGAALQVAVAIGCAIAGLGVWSLVAGLIAGAAGQCAVYWAFARPWPSMFGVKGSVLRDLLRYGRYVSASNLVVIVNTNVDNVVIARSLGAAQLGLYGVVWRLAELPITVIGTIVGRVMFPVYSLLQHDVSAVRAAYIQNVQRTMLLALPGSVTLAVAAEPIVLGLFGPSWAGAIGALRLLAVFGAIRLLVAPSGELLKGIGRPQLSFISTIAFLICAVPALLVLVPRLGITGGALAMLIAIICAGSIPLALTFRVLALPPGELARALARPAGCAGLVAAGLLVTLPVAEGLHTTAQLAAVTLVSSGTFLIAVMLLGRPLVSPIWAGFRRT